MIKFDKDVHGALKTLEKAGFETYASGECVRESIRGIMPYDWDLVTTATLKEMRELFPEGEVLDEDDQILRMDYTYQVGGGDKESRMEGAVVDIRTMTTSVEEYLKGNVFTVNAMADNPDRAFVDPYNGRDDMKKQLVRTIGNPDDVFKNDPIRMMEAVRTCAELGYDLQKGTYDGILSNWKVLLYGNMDYVRDELSRLVVGDFAGKGLNIMAGTGLMAVVLGEEVSRKISASEMKSFTTLCDNIGKTQPVMRRRLGLLYTCFSKKRGLEAIERMNFDEKTHMHLVDGMNEMINIQFLGNMKDFKRYIFEMGLERYNYIHNLNKAQRIIYDSPTTKIESRNYMMKEIRSKNEPVFVEDLVIDGNDLMEAGIAGSPEMAEELLRLVMAQVHHDPRNNDRKYLLKMAKKYSKSKFAAKTRYVKWLK